MRQIADSVKGRAGYEDRFLAAESDTEAYFGKIVESRRLQQQAIATAVKDGAKGRLAYYNAYAALREGELENKSVAREYAMKALVASDGRDIKVVSALALAKAGLTTDAAKLADELEMEFPQDMMMRSFVLPTIRAQVELNRGRAREAIQALESALPYELGHAEFGSLEPAYVRGLAYLKIGDGKGARIEFQKLVGRPGLINNFVTGALVQLQLGRASALMGNRDEARRYYQDFLAIWKDADRDQPIYQQAKQEYARLK